MLSASIITAWSSGQDGELIIWSESKRDKGFV